MEGLMAHVDTEQTDRDMLRLLPTPEPLPGSMYHRPVRHDVLVDEIEIGLNDRGWEVNKFLVSLSKDYMKMFGVFHLNATRHIDGLPTDLVSRTQHEGRGFMVGFRSGNDQSMALSGVAGSSVFVCDNMMFNGDMFIFSKKHTTNTNIKHMVSAGLDQLPIELTKTENDIWAMSAQQLTLDEARLETFRAFETGRVAAPKYMLPVWETYRDATNDNAPEINGSKGNRWGLHNAFTRVFSHGHDGKGENQHSSVTPMSNSNKFKSTIKLGKFFSS